MSAHALVTGTLYRDPIMGTSKTGKAFVAARWALARVRLPMEHSAQTRRRKAGQKRPDDDHCNQFTEHGPLPPTYPSGAYACL